MPLQQAAQCSRVLLSAVPHLVRSIWDPVWPRVAAGPVVVAAVALLVQADPVQAVAVPPLVLQLLRARQPLRVPARQLLEQLRLVSVPL